VAFVVSVPSTPMLKETVEAGGSVKETLGKLGKMFANDTTLKRLLL